MKTKRLPIKYESLVSGKYGNAGPDANVAGMKQHFWGKDAVCVICGRYVYYLGRNEDALGDEEREIYYGLAR